MSATLNQTACQIREVVYVLPAVPCDRCQQPAQRVTTAHRIAIDLDLDHPTLVLVTVGVHHCPPCRHYFRCQPPFLRPDASYTNRVVATAVAAVYQAPINAVHTRGWTSTPRSPSCSLPVMHPSGGMRCWAACGTVTTRGRGGPVQVPDSLSAQNGPAGRPAMLNPFSIRRQRVFDGRSLGLCHCLHD